ncbi:MAG: hypothetical protein MJZ22_02775 [Candidatus Saccharibacteria bacterium]|nr:hypothetical protein [Candidatus Saccharibacteria bacterium]
MDPLYANYDKRKKTLDENSAPVPQPTPNSMPVFGAATAPTPKPASEPVSEPEPEPEAELVIDHSPAAPESVPEPIAAPTPAVEPTPEPAPVQNPFETQQQPTAFEQQFEQMIDGAAPAQLSQPQPQFNPNYTGTGDIVLNLDQPKKKFNTKIIAIIAGIVVVTVLAVVLIAMGGGNKGGVAKNNKQDIMSFVEYFVFGTEGENEVTDEIMNNKLGSFDFIKKSHAENTEKNINYKKAILGKVRAINGASELAEKIDIYTTSTRDLYTDFLTQSYIDNQDIDDIEYDGEDRDIKNIIKNLNQYRNYISEYIQDMKAGSCIEEGEVDLDCRAEYYDNNDDSIFEKRDETFKRVKADNEIIEQNIIKDVVKIYEKNK